MMNEAFRLRYVNQIVGVFILLIVFVLLVLLLYLVRAKELFIGSLPYQIITSQEQLDGLRHGTEVLLLGQQVGRIERVHYTNGGSDVAILLLIKETVADQIFVDSRVAVRRKFGVGEPYLEILRGPKSSQSLRPAVPGEPALIRYFEPAQDQLEELATRLRNVETAMVPALKDVSAASQTADRELKESAAPMMRDVSQAAQTFDAAVQNLDQKAGETLAKVNQSADNLDVNVRRITASVDKIQADSGRTFQNFRNTSQAFRESVDNFENTSVSAFSQLDRTAKEMQTAVGEAREVIGALRSETRDLPGTTARVNEAVGGAQEVIEALRSHWLLRRYVDQDRATEQLSPSSIQGGIFP